MYQEGLDPMYCWQAIGVTAGAPRVARSEGRAQIDEFLDLDLHSFTRESASELDAAIAAARAWH